MAFNMLFHVSWLLSFWAFWIDLSSWHCTRWPLLLIVDTKCYEHGPKNIFIELSAMTLNYEPEEEPLKQD